MVDIQAMNTEQAYSKLTQQWRTTRHVRLLQAWELGVLAACNQFLFARVGMKKRLVFKDLNDEVRMWNNHPPPTPISKRIRFDCSPCTLAEDFQAPLVCTITEWDTVSILFHFSHSRQLLIYVATALA